METNDAEVLGMFVEESREHMQQFEEDLLSLEENGEDDELINRIFRAVHSVKGGAGFFGLKSIGTLSHTMENVMSRMRDGKLKPGKQIIDILLASGDTLRAMIDDVDHSESIDFAKHVSDLETLLNDSGGQINSVRVSVEEGKVSESIGDFEISEELLQEAVKHGQHLYTVKVYTQKDIKDKGKTPLDYIEMLDSFGQFIDSYIDMDSVSGLDDCLDVDLPFIFVFITVLEDQLISIGLEIPEEQITVVPLKFNKKELKSEKVGDKPMPEGKAVVEVVTPKVEKFATQAVVKSKAGEQVPEKKKVKVKSEETVRVHVSLLDDLMNLAGEMVLGRNQLLLMSEDITKNVPGLASVLQNINLVTSELQEKVMRTRMQPIGVIFSKFNRIIRDMSRLLNKEMILDIQGADVELDKSILEMLSDPLTHLVRNSADHGIELPEVREATGKNRVGHIQLQAKHEGGQVHIEIIDDGKGIDPQVLREIAVKKGIMTEEIAAELSDKEALTIIFMPGFSTAEKVSDISGRGVGMDVVRTNIEQLGGTIDLDSEIGHGSRIVLRLPLTLAIIPSMVVVTAGQRYAIPQVNLEEIVRLGGEQKLEKISGSEVLRLRGKLLPLVNLGKLLGQGEIEDSKKSFVLVLKAEKNSFGLIVDDIRDSEEIVVKPLSKYLKRCKCYSGATIMGDGKLAMILDVPGIVTSANLSFAEVDAAEDHNKKDNAVALQSLLLFRNSDEELFAINLELIRRIEKVEAKDVEKVGYREFLKYADNSMRILRLHEFLPITKTETNAESFHVIVPKLVKHPMGIVATKIVDVVEAEIHLSHDNVKGKGILGSAIVNSELVVFIDIYGLFEEAEPEIYGYDRTLKDLFNKQVLLAEDTEFFRNVAGKYLRGFGCNLTIANDGEEAWELLNNNDYDLLITDVEMPGMDGFELTRKVRASEKFANIPIIALTSLTEKAFINKGFEAGVDFYENKLDREHLRTTINKIFDGTLSRRRSDDRTAMVMEQLPVLDNS